MMLLLFFIMYIDFALYVYNKQHTIQIQRKKESERIIYFRPRIKVWVFIYNVCMDANYPTKPKTKTKKKRQQQTLLKL